MCIFHCLRRWWRAKGHGVHSPFAYWFITNVLHLRHGFNAFADIENLLANNGINPETVTVFNRLSFRLVHYLKPVRILEIGSGTGINTLFITAPRAGISCTCVENRAENVAVARRLLHQYGKSASFRTLDELKNHEPFDAIFVHTDSALPIDTGMLSALSHEKTFWVFHPAQNKFHRKVVKDSCVRVSFHTKRTSIYFLDTSYHKLNYWV